MDDFDDNTCVESFDLDGNAEFESRPVDGRLSLLHLSVLQRLVQVFVLQPEHVLQELVDVAISLCGADSAGVSLETADAEGRPIYHWVATSGTYTRFRNA